MFNIVRLKLITHVAHVGYIQLIHRVNYLRLLNNESVL